MSKSILWYQPQDPKLDDIIFLNGERLKNKQDIQDNFYIICSAVNKVSNKETPWCGIVNGYFFLKGYLDMKDNVGRTMSFIYVTDSEDYESSCVAELKAAGLEMSAQTVVCLFDKKRIMFPPKWLVIVLLAILSIIFIIILCCQSI